MKKKVILFSILVICLVTIFNFNYLIKSENKYTQITFENIEVLAAGEDITGHIDCWGKGNKFCPIDHRADYEKIIIPQ